MDTIRALPSREIRDVVVPTIGAYVPLLVGNADNIKPAASAKQTYNYGSHERQKLDVYLPSSATGQQRQRVLVFVYGGGWRQGDRTLAVPALQGLVHANIGAFFTQQGFTVVVVDYRLLGGQRGEVKFPDGGKDVSLAVEWLIQNTDKLTGKAGDGVDLFLLGNSAGGANISTFWLHDDFASTRAKVFADDAKARLKGITLLGTPFDFQAAAGPLAETVKEYYGTAAEHGSPLGLLKAKVSQPDWIRAGTKILVMNSEFDPQATILDPNDRFIETYKSKYGDLDTKRIEGHNHISLIFAVGTGNTQEEAWAKYLADWMQQIN